MGAWIETITWRQRVAEFRSRPAWARGLKPNGSGISFKLSLSRPAWARGLKPDSTLIIVGTEGVAPRMGAWIETTLFPKSVTQSFMSRPAWARGLKQHPKSHYAPHQMSRPAWARGLKHPTDYRENYAHKSRPAWARGLKPVKVSRNHLAIFSRAPHGRVD